MSSSYRMFIITVLSFKALSSPAMKKNPLQQKRVAVAQAGEYLTTCLLIVSSACSSVLKQDTEPQNVSQHDNLPFIFSIITFFYKMSEIIRN